MQSHSILYGHINRFTDKQTNIITTYAHAHGNRARAKVACLELFVALGRMTCENQQGEKERNSMKQIREEGARRKSRREKKRREGKRGEECRV